ncbi:hypothetical protein ACH47Z_40945 [Streptomyces sp. NPDC020192]|uniref:hypothetical protein n=1 Tax=Streptomyces sp. NPDC020192 TaxID=3365066 RepID=UPI0037B79075
MREIAERARGVLAWAIPLAVVAASAATATVIVTERESGVEVGTQVHVSAPAAAKPASLTVPKGAASHGRGAGHHKPKSPVGGHH